MQLQLTTTTLLLSLLTLTTAIPAPAPAAVSEGTVLQTNPTTNTTGLDTLDLNKRAFDGRFTYYNPGLGACGKWNGDNDLVVALNAQQFDPYTPNGNPNNNSKCGKKIKASYNGKSVTVTLVDRCPGCPWGGLDLSPAAFKKLAPLDVGVLQGTWDWA